MMKRKNTYYRFTQMSLKNLGPSSSEETVEVNMKKNDIDQWKLDLNDYKTSSLVEKFIKN
ncbi:hypothetical protein BsIDN1_04990 [Bacillus safensis]|uniref:DUF5105 domain-containing protein n=1 Tax=Bacillus safensis TaxID=561879 RepID=A0A5S9M1M3_BACIA|nr:hypothetical protein BsIDN1_04990 [Bacillus safensis]